MSNIDSLKLMFNEYLIKYSDNDSKLEIIKIILTSFDKIINKYEKDLLKKESDINNINEFVEYFFCTYRNFYYYIDKFNAYYEYHDTGNLILINSDKILVEIAKLIPENLYKHKSIIQKIIINNIKKNTLFNQDNNFELNKKTYKIVKNILSKFIQDEKQFTYILCYFNAIMHNSDIIDDEHIQLWWGNSAIVFMENIKAIMIDCLRSYSKKLNNIKFSYNNYDFSKIKLIKFNDSVISKNIINDIKKNKENILVTFYYIDQIIPSNTIKKRISSINCFNKFKNKQYFLKKLTDENIILEKHSNIYIKEIYNFINNILCELELPNPIFSFNDVAEFLEKKYASNVDDNSIASIILRKIPGNSKNVIDGDIWTDGKQTVKNGEKIKFLEEVGDYAKISTDNNIVGYIKNDNLSEDKTFIKIRVTDSRANLKLNGIALKGFNRIEIIKDFCDENLVYCTTGSIRLKELYDVFKKWYYYKEDYILYPNRDEILEYFSKRYANHWNESKNKYINIKFTCYDKLKFLNDFLGENIKIEKNSYVSMDIFYNTFKNWFRSQNDDYLYPDKDDIKEYMLNEFEYKKYKGWCDITISKNNNNLSINDIQELEKEVLKSQSLNLE